VSISEQRTVATHSSISSRLKIVILTLMQQLVLYPVRNENKTIVDVDQIRIIVRRSTLCLVPRSASDGKLL